MSRLIDAEKLYLDIVEKGQSSKRYKIGEFWELNCAEIEEVIDNQPTVEVEPRICGYRPEYLMGIAEALEKAGLTPERASEVAGDAWSLAQMMIDEWSKDFAEHCAKLAGLER